MPTRVVALLQISLLAACAPTPRLLAHEPHEPHSPASTSAQTQTATGIVYEDLDQDRVRDPDEPGIAGVRVSNGKEIVRTDESGKYALPVSNDAIVFVIKPRGYKTPVNAYQLPQFYYIHKPEGSPKNFKFPGVKPTGPLPESIDFPLTKQVEPDTFKAILFGDPQPRNVREVEYIEHDVIEQIIAEQAHGASFGVTLGDIVFDDLSVFDPLKRAIALIDIPWYNVIGNHDLNYDAPNDELSDETFERHFGPAYYSFDYGPAHFLVLDDVEWVGAHDGERAHYHGGLGKRQLAFIKNDLALIPEEQLVVLMMHIPLTGVDDRQQLYRLIEQRPATVSISAHTHYMEHRFIGKEDGWRGPERHHHIVNVTVCGSWWRGQPDERGIPHATMSDGGPNGYSIMEFDGANYQLEFHAAGRPAKYQMNIYAPEVVKGVELAKTVVLANVFAASEKWTSRMRVASGEWQDMQRITIVDPGYLEEMQRDAALGEHPWPELPGPHATPHVYRAMLPTQLPAGSHLIEIEAESDGGRKVRGTRILRVE